MTTRRTILILEDNDERIRGLAATVAQFGRNLSVKIWRDAPIFMAECDEFLPDAALISLDHDLNPVSPKQPDPGTGLDVAQFLARLPSICPVILHSSNTDRVWSMHNEFRFAGWRVERVGPLGDDWIARSWSPVARALLEEFSRDSERFYSCTRTTNHRERFDRALLSLNGLAIGDGIGEMMFSRPERAYDMIAKNQLPAGPWWHTDDTEMGISIVEVLRLLGSIDQDALARQFAWRYEREPDRGYGSGARQQLRMMIGRVEWRVTSRDAFSGQGSMGNGSAMRVAPVGAWFADDLGRVAKQARASAMVTHMHSEGVAGAIAVAVAAAMAWRLRDNTSQDAGVEFLNEVHKHTPDGETRRRIAHAFQIRQLDSPQAAARLLGNGSGVTCPDTVPFALWAAAKFLRKYREAIAATASAGGDVDTNCAIVGGIVALSAGWEGLPQNWIQEMEQLPFQQAKPA